MCRGVRAYDQRKPAAHTRCRTTAEDGASAPRFLKGCPISWGWVLNNNPCEDQRVWVKIRNGTGPYTCTYKRFLKLPINLNVHDFGLWEETPGENPRRHEPANSTQKGLESNPEPSRCEATALTSNLIRTETFKWLFYLTKTC